MLPDTVLEMGYGAPHHNLPEPSTQQSVALRLMMKTMCASFLSTEHHRSQTGTVVSLAKSDA